MRYFTSNPLERLMMQAPPPRQEQRAKPAPPKDHPCHGCKRCGELRPALLPGCGGDTAHSVPRPHPVPINNLLRMWDNCGMIELQRRSILCRELSLSVT